MAFRVWARTGTDVANRSLHAPHLNREVWLVSRAARYWGSPHRSHFWLASAGINVGRAHRMYCVTKSSNSEDPVLKFIEQPSAAKPPGSLRVRTRRATFYTFAIHLQGDRDVFFDV